MPVKIVPIIDPAGMKEIRLELKENAINGFLT